jgi:glycosyltransferase involved in cell wall biosynthesis
LENNLERVYLHQRVPHSEIPKTIENYDFGLFWFNIDEEIKKIYAMDFQSSVNGRFISYVAAGIPIIINDKLTLLSKIVKENKIGIIINNDDAKNLENIIRSYNYCQMKKKMKEFQVKFIKQNYEQRLKNFLIDITKDKDD